MKEELKGQAHRICRVLVHLCLKKYILGNQDLRFEYLLHFYLIYNKSVIYYA